MDGKDTTFSKKQEAVLNNPFTIHNNTPKWPDGLASYSLGVKHQRTTEVRGMEHLIVLFPGLVNWLCCYSLIRDPIPETAPVSGGDPRPLPPSERKTFTMTACHGLNQGDDDIVKFKIVNEHIIRDTEEKVVEWRPVSIGLRLYCANTDRTNEGWIEAVRVPHGQIREFFSLIHFQAQDATDEYPTLYHTQPNPNPFTLQYPHMGGQVSQGMLSLSENYIKKITRGYLDYGMFLASLPGYGTIPLKDVADYQFCLNPNKHYNEFNTIRNFHFGTNEYWNPTSHRWYTYDFLAPGYVLVGQGGTQEENRTWIERSYVQSMDKNTEIHVENTAFLDQGFESNAFDTIILRVHGMENSRLVIHTAANYEYLTTNAQETGVSVTYSDLPMVNRYIERRNAFHKLPFDSKSLYPDTRY